MYNIQCYFFAAMLFKFSTAFSIFFYRKISGLDAFFCGVPVGIVDRKAVE